MLVDYQQGLLANYVPDCSLTDAMLNRLAALQPKRLATMHGSVYVGDGVIAALTTEQRTLVNQVIDDMAPVSPRYAGIAFDNKAAVPNERIAAICAPTLIVHATDDSLQLFHNAEYAAANIPGSRLLSCNRGGHLLFAVELAAIQAEVRQFIIAHSGRSVRGTNME
jgi:pimeloyl-ACP methyl ester carboxylesterase